MKAVIIPVAFLAISVLAQAETAPTSGSDIVLTLDSKPSFSIDGTQTATFVDPWGGSSRSNAIREKVLSYHREPHWFDILDSAMRLQHLRFNAILSGKLLPAINPELGRKD